MYNGENTLIAKWLSKYDDKTRLLRKTIIILMEASMQRNL